jgi:hypothetical protein
VGVHDLRLKASRPAARVSRELQVAALAAGPPVQHGELELVPALAQRGFDLRDEGAEIRIRGARIHLRDKQDAHARSLALSSRPVTVSAG